MRHPRTGACCALTLLAAAATAHAGILYDESASGDLSNSQAAPAARIAVLGTNSVLGTVGTADAQDWLTITVPAGDQLSALTLASYASIDNQGFMGVQAGGTFVGSTSNPASYLGYVHWGTGATNGALPPTNVVGTDLLPLMGNNTIASGSAGFAPPLGAGQYTFLIQQLGASTTYQFDFSVTAAPEPASISLLAFGAAALLIKRRRSVV